MPLESVFFAGGGHELPHSGGFGGRKSPRIKGRFDSCEIHHVGRNTLLLEYRGYDGKISVGAFKSQERIAMGVTHGRKLAVEPFPHVGVVKRNLFACKCHVLRYDG